MNNSNRSNHLSAFIEKMEKENIPVTVINTFSYYYKKVLSGEQGLISDKQIQPISPQEIEKAENLSTYEKTGKEILNKAIVIKLNGGLGTSMGLTGPKSLLEVKQGRSFLEIIINQVKRQGVRLALMNSFNTYEETKEALDKLKPSDYPLTFLQNMYPKIDKKLHTPVTWSQNPDLEWNPPGHGDVYTALYTSGTLEDLLSQGIEYAFISNSDNLGAIMDTSLLGYFKEKGFNFMMEVAQKTPSDVKGGHLAKKKNQGYVLRESAQCPKDELDAFRDIKKYGFFNTNNIWINLNYLKRVFDEKGIIHLPIIVNPKTVDPRDEKSTEVYQIETAMGAAISQMENSTAVIVQRSRFLPVKKCNDLLAIRSDCYIFSQDGNIIVNPKRKNDTIKIQLDSRYFKGIDDFSQRFSQGVPSLVNCESLSVTGDVSFDKNVTIKGKVAIENPGKSQLVIKQGTTIDR